jgi:hypothetical protein
MVWELTKANGDIQSPRTYHNGKTQETVVDEIVTSFDDNKFVIVVGVVGSGKSAIALHVIKRMGGGIIVVPTKVLEHQYVDDYCGGKKYHIPDLPVEYMVGKGNFKCRYVSNRWSCTHSDEPCNRPLKKDIIDDEGNHRSESRLQVAKECPYWAPVYGGQSVDRATEVLGESYSTIRYSAIGGEKFWFMPQHPCDYYAQFSYYTKACALIMNQAKWEIETLIERKPAVPVEIVDEADGFLDSLSYQVEITERFFSAVKKENFVDDDDLITLEDAFAEIVHDLDGFEGKLNSDIVLFIENFKNSLKDCSTSSVAFEKLSKLTQILECSDYAYACIKNNSIKIFMPRPDIALRKLFANSHKVVLMSGTMQSAETLKEVFRLEDAHLIIAEDIPPGELRIKMTGREASVTYGNWQNPQFQADYHRTLSHMVKMSQKPCLVQVHAKKYVPQEYLGLLEANDFVDNVWWSTKTDRGVDLPDDSCRSIVIMKYPLPDMNDVVLKTMRALLGEGKFWLYMNDIAGRNLLQQCGRGVRHNDDWCEIWSPDSKCISQLLKLWRGRKTVEHIVDPRAGKTLRELQAMARSQ